jgi:hypothetical protein
MPNGHPSELMDIYRQELADERALNKQLRETNADTIMAMDQMRAEGALIVHALERALQLTEVLMSTLRAGEIVPPGVATCKHALDDAMRAITNRRKTP